MKILIYSPLFYPSVGGTETVMGILAQQFHHFGHEVQVVTQTLAVEPDCFPFAIVRRPNPQTLLNLTRWCDVYFQSCISLKGVWPLLLVRRTFCVNHHIWYRREDGTRGWQDHLKRWVTRFATNISISQAIADDLPVPSVIVPNPYQDNLFRLLPEVPRDRTLIFLGRLVSDKGVDVLVEALGILKHQEGLTPDLTIVGEGPEEPALRKQIEALCLMDQVQFVGIKTGENLVQILNQHQILVVPSRWEEPFGIVALEGMACGCWVIGSAGGGLKDALGAWGETFPNGDGEALARSLAQALKNPAILSAHREQVTQHLARHTMATVAKAYLAVFERSLP
ncbi:MAG: glycosyltransferase family 4 protein [Leptolyngbyaceae cyanobacterium bins.59]|nr:glycosyltransferase family 4 protein [Leptolyngbyaceae cyanobacterium bins.59]